MNTRNAFREFVQDHAGELPQPVASPASSPLSSYIGPVPTSTTHPQAFPTTFPESGGPAGPTNQPLPDFKLASNVKPGRVSLPSLLIDGMLHRGCKMVLAGGSKSFKSWSLMDLGLAIATGSEWWGMKCNPGRVLYINFELIDGFFEQRLLTMAQSRQIELPQSFMYWGLRGRCYDLQVLAKVLQARIASAGQIDLLIVDPIYKALGDLDENSAGDMGRLMQAVEELSDAIGSAVVFGAHFSKGSQVGKDSIDRISGSGVFARDPDAILTMTRHKDPGSYVVESELRYLPMLPDFVVSWDFPRMRIDEGKDPRELWEPGGGAGGGGNEQGDRMPAFTDNDVLALLPHAGLQDPAWRTLVVRSFGRAGKPFYESKKRMLEEGKVVKRGLVYCKADLNLTAD
jgi:hypothetical protein